MCGGSKKQTTNSTSTYAPNTTAMGAFTGALDQGQQLADTPFNYGTTQNVAGFNPQQMQSFNQVGQMQGMFAPYIDAASGYTAAGAAPITGQQIQNYQNPYQQQVIDATMANINHQNATQQRDLVGNVAAQQGLGNNRAGVMQAELARGQGANTNQTIANLLSGGFNTALGAAQSDASRQLTAGNQMANYGNMAQNLSLQGSQALNSVGNQQQQQLQNLYNTASSNQQMATMWPYQNAQFQAALAAGLGPLMGGTTTGTGTTTQTQNPGAGQYAGMALSALALMSDKRVKEDIEPVGKLDDGQTVYKYRIEGDPRFQIGLMAQDVEKVHPEAVGEVGGVKMVNYDEATKRAAKGHADGGTIGDMSGFAFPFSSLRPAQPIIPQAPQTLNMSASSGGSGGDFDPKKSFDLGKSARSGIDNILRDLDPAKGWGASIENIGGGSGGGMLSGLGGLLGFADGGSTPLPATPRLSGSSFVPGERSVPGAAPDSYYAPGLAALSASRGPQLTAAPVTASNVPTASGGKGMSGLFDLFGGGQNGASDWLSKLMQGHARGGAVRRYDDGGMVDYTPQNIGEIGDRVSPPYQRSVMDLLTGNSKPHDENFQQFMQKWNEPQKTAPQQTVSTQNKTDTLPAGVPAELLSDEPIAGMAKPFTGGAFPQPAGSQQGASGGDDLAFIKEQEGYAPTAKWDVKQYSGGYGSRAEKGETFTPEKADAYLARDAAAPRAWLAENLPNATPGQRQALVSFGYNEGVGALDKLRGDIEFGDWGKVGEHMLEYNKSRDANGDLVYNPGLASRRQREVALLTGSDASALGGPSYPTPSGGFNPKDSGIQSDTTAPAVKSLVAKGMDSEQSQASKGYSGAADKHAGGLLQRLFGIDFNPLNLDHNERMALLTAGLGMMSTGNIGSGGLMGMEFLQNSRVQQQNASLAAQKLAMEFEKERMPKLTESGTDPLTGQKNFVWADPYHQTTTPVAGPAGGGGNAASSDIASALNSGATGDELLKQVPQNVANTVKMMVEGKMAPPTSFAMSKPYWQTMISLARQYDDNFDESKWGLRNKAAKDYSPGGFAGKQITYANTSLGHLGDLWDASKELGGSNYPIVNAIGQKIGRETGSAATNKWNAIRNTYAADLERLFAGGSGSEGEKKRMLDELEAASTPHQREVVMQAQAKLLMQRVKTLEEQRQDIMGDKSKLEPLLKKEAKSVLKKLGVDDGDTPSGDLSAQKQGSAFAAVPRPSGKSDIQLLHDAQEKLKSSPSLAPKIQKQLQEWGVQF